MIDYDKLKLAHELAEKYAESKDSCTSLSITVRFGGLGGNEYQADFCGVEAYEEIDPTTLDKLITKLQELTHPEPKYTVGSTWWFLNGPSFDRYPTPKSLLITEQNQGWYRKDDEWFPSREALIQDQIDYWAKLLENYGKDENCYCGQIDKDGNEIERCGYCPKFEVENQEFNDRIETQCGQVKPTTNDLPIYTESVDCLHDFRRGVCIKCGEFYI